MMTVIHSWFQYCNKEWGNPSEAVCFWGFQYVCVNTERKQPTLWPGTQGGLGRRTPTHTHTHTVVNTFFCSLVWKDSSGPAVPLQAQLWPLTLFRENISFTLWCLLVYKKANPALKIARLVWNSGRMKQTLWDTDASENHLYFPFGSCDHLVILWCKCGWHLLGLNTDGWFHYAVCSPQLQWEYYFNTDGIVSDM